MANTADQIFWEQRLVKEMFVSSKYYNRDKYVNKSTDVDQFSPFLATNNGIGGSKTYSKPISTRQLLLENLRNENEQRGRIEVNLRRAPSCIEIREETKTMPIQLSKIPEKKDSKHIVDPNQNEGIRRLNTVTHKINLVTMNNDLEKREEFPEFKVRKIQKMNSLALTPKNKPGFDFIGKLASEPQSTKSSSTKDIFFAAFDPTCKSIGKTESHPKALSSARVKKLLRLRESCQGNKIFLERKPTLVPLNVKNHQLKRVQEAPMKSRKSPIRMPDKTNETTKKKETSLTYGSFAKIKGSNEVRGFSTAKNKQELDSYHSKLRI